MKTVFGITHLRYIQKRAVVALGVFDGVHRGHQKIIRYIVRCARKINGCSVVMTFDPHPVHVLSPGKYCPLIIPLKHRLQLIGHLGVDWIIVIRFTKLFALLECEKFVRKHLVGKINLDEVVVGDDFYFGRDHRGTAKRLAALGHRYGFGTTIIPVRRHGQKIISSSHIRYCITDGQLGKAERLLGRAVSITGKVIHGDARGKTLGYPTANIQLTRQVLLPSGVFIVCIRLNDHRYHGIASVGRRPSFKTIHNVNVEVHIFNFRKNIYGKELEIEFLKKIREERVFCCKEELIRQIQEDEKHARYYFKTQAKGSLGNG